MANLKKLKAVFVLAVRAERFSERKLYQETAVLRASELAQRLTSELEKFLPPAQVEVAHRRLVRVAFLIELVKADVTSTKYDVRWTTRLDDADPRKASFEECFAIHESLCRQFLDLLPEHDFQEIVKLFVPWGLSPHEIPVDYESKSAVPIHSAENLGVLRDPEYLARVIEDAAVSA